MILLEPKTTGLVPDGFHQCIDTRMRYEDDASSSCISCRQYHCCQLDYLRARIAHTWNNIYGRTLVRSLTTSMQQPHKMKECLVSRQMIEWGNEGWAGGDNGSGAYQMHITNLKHAKLITINCKYVYFLRKMRRSYIFIVFFVSWFMASWFFFCLTMTDCFRLSV